MSKVLEGVRVIDLSWGIAGPVTGMLLADHGADVVKIEPPGGDPFRASAGYAAWLRGRRSLELGYFFADGDWRGEFMRRAGAYKASTYIQDAIRMSAKFSRTTNRSNFAQAWGWAWSSTARAARNK